MNAVLDPDNDFHEATPLSSYVCCLLSSVTRGEVEIIVSRGQERLWGHLCRLVEACEVAGTQPCPVGDDVILVGHLLLAAAGDHQLERDLFAHVCSSRHASSIALSYSNFLFVSSFRGRGSWLRILFL